MRLGDPRFLDNFGNVRDGVKRATRTPAPAVGVDWSVQVPGGVIWRIVGGVVSLATSAVVANRLPVVQITHRGVLVYVGANTTPIAAGANQQLVLQRSSSPTLAGALGVSLPVPIQDYLLGPGDTLSVITTALDVGDQWSAINLAVEEYYFTDAELTGWQEEREQIRARLLAELAGEAPAAAPTFRTS